ncbi:MAG: hypothetical protein LBH00_06290, partial [Planctomycetaceae bacterium]|nr:hypothetical protein [Planctomycetaceae bacterium]
ATIPEYTETIGPLPPKTEPLIAPLPKKITPQRSSNRLPAMSAASAVAKPAAVKVSKNLDDSNKSYADAGMSFGL